MLIPFFIISCSEPRYDCNVKLYAVHPASIWEETFPLGNGRLGLTPYGNTATELVNLNEISMWSGCESDYGNPEAATSLPHIRQLLFDGKNAEAQELMYKTFVPKSTSSGTYGAYQVLANMLITTPQLINKKYIDYSRRLDMQNGIQTIDFQDENQCKYHREYFASRNIDAIIARYESSEKSDFFVQISRPECGKISILNNQLILEGELQSGDENVDGVKYIAKVIVQTNGQIVANDTAIKIVDATESEIVISSATSYLYGESYCEYVDSILKNVQNQSYRQMREAHAACHSALFNRTRIHLTPIATNQRLTTEQRLKNYQQDEDPAFVELYYNFGRYSLISSTRQGSLPPNLQGLWANECGTPWNGDYHTNINIQMNHWPLEQGNLDELYEPLVRLVEQAVESGQKTAKTFYGHDARGWVMHMMTNVWHFTAPGEHPSWGATNTGGAWLCAHLWERFQYTLDTAYLERIYPTLRGAAEFFVSTMVREPKHNWLVTAPTSSPENSFVIDNKQISVCMAPTMDIQLVHELYDNVSKAAHILSIDKEFADSLEYLITQLPPIQISPNGYLQEWLEDYTEVDIHHRHVSHLYGLHPSNQISPITTPELAEACRNTLNRRGDEGTGWSRAWKINFWARLADGNRAAKLLKSLFIPAVDSITQQHHSGTFPNLWCSHPPFQLDGNFGGAAGIAEMLLQSHEGFINILPALPDKWHDGSVDRMKIRGGAEISFSWRDNKLAKISLTGGKVAIYKILLPSNISMAKVDGQSIEIKSEGTNRFIFINTNSTVEFN